VRNARSAAIDARIGGHDPPRFPSTLSGCYRHRLLPVCCPTAPPADLRDHNLICLSALAVMDLLELVGTDFVAHRLPSLGLGSIL
jgi:hypothetical protein